MMKVQIKMVDLVLMCRVSVSHLVFTWTMQSSLSKKVRLITVSVIRKD